MFQPEDVESEEEKEEEVPGTPGQNQLPLPPLIGALGEPHFLEPRRSPRKKQTPLPSRTQTDPELGTPRCDHPDPLEASVLDNVSRFSTLTYNITL
jgi:hypothetical protein